MKGLIKRGGTAFVFVLVMVGAVYLHPFSFSLLFITITAMAIWEYLMLTVPTNANKWAGLVIGILPILATTFYSMQAITNTAFGVHALLLFLPLLLLLFILELFSTNEMPFTTIGHYLIGVLYIGCSLALVPLIGIKTGQFFPNIVFGLLLLTWMNDTGAYLIGSQIGRTKLFPRISPNKTWEGSLGGVAVTLLTGYLLSLFFNDLSLSNWLVLAGIVAIFGSLGDLVESMLKRSLQIKDSGTLLPGHGGMLDRFDAFIFLIPFAAVYLLW